MNKDWVLSHLREALEELTHTIARIETQLEYNEAEFGIAMEHLYNHLNTAWNSRNADAQRIAECSGSDFYTWRAFPSDIPMEP